MPPRHQWHRARPEVHDARSLLLPERLYPLTTSLATSIPTAAWRDLLHRSDSDHVFASPDWKAAWHRTLGSRETPHHLAIEEGGRLVALATLAQRDDRLVWDGGPDISDFLDFVVERGRAPQLVPALLDQVAALPWTTLQLDCIRADSPTPELVRRWATARGYGVTIEQQTVSPVIHLRGDWEEYLAGLDKKDRHELRRKLRRLEAAGPCTFRVVEDPAELPTATNEFLRLLRLSDPAKAAFMTPAMEESFRAILDATFACGVLRLYQLVFEGAVVSAVICFDDGRDELMLYNSGYDPEYRHLSVGLLLKVMCIQEAIRLGKSVYNTLRGDERYKYDIGAVDTGIFQVVVTREAST